MVPKPLTIQLPDRLISEQYLKESLTVWLHKLTYWPMVLLNVTSPPNLNCCLQYLVAYKYSGIRPAWESLSRLVMSCKRVTHGRLCPTQWESSRSQLVTSQFTRPFPFCRSASGSHDYACLNSGNYNICNAASKDCVQYSELVYDKFLLTTYCSVCLMLHDITTHDNISHASSLC